MIPQAIAYAALAQLPSQYGLYAAFMGKYKAIHMFFYVRRGYSGYLMDITIN